MSPATLKFVKLLIELPPVVALLLYRTSPPYLMVCAPLVQLSVSPKVQTADRSMLVIVMLFPPPNALPAHVPGGRPPVIGLQRAMPVIMSGRIRSPFTGV